LSTPTPTVAVPAGTPGTTPTTMAPPAPPFLPPTGGGEGDQSWTGPIVLLLGVLLMLIGMNTRTRMLFRRADIKVRGGKGS
jgi:hypothetical protein